MSIIPHRRELKSADFRRIGSFEPHTMDVGNGKPVAAYRVIRTVRRRRGFGTIIHTLTTFVSSRKKAQRLIANWVKLTTKDR